MILWDLAGLEELVNVRSSYLRGSAGAILVADGTRGETLEVIFDLKRNLFDAAGEVPVVLMVNKSDLRDSWNIDTQKLADLHESGWSVFESSAKDGSNVNRAFQGLALQLFAGMAR